MNYQNNKSFLIDAYNIENEKIFLCFKNIIGNYITVETMPGSYSHTTVCEWETLKEMINGITWHNWIKSSIRDKQLKKLTKNK